MYGESFGVRSPTTAVPLTPLYGASVNWIVTETNAAGEAWWWAVQSLHFSNYDDTAVHLIALRRRNFYWSSHAGQSRGQNPISVASGMHCTFICFAIQGELTMTDSSQSYDAVQLGLSSHSTVKHWLFVLCWQCHIRRCTLCCFVHSLVMFCLRTSSPIRGGDQKVIKRPCPYPDP